MGYTVKCEVCNMYVSLEICRAYSLRFFTEGKHHGAPRLESVELGGREPWAGIRLVCKPCLQFLRTLDGAENEPPVHLREFVAGRVESLDLLTMALAAVADDLRGTLGSQEPRGGAHGPEEVRSVEQPPWIAPRGSQEPPRHVVPPLPVDPGAYPP